MHGLNGDLDQLAKKKKDAVLETKGIDIIEEDINRYSPALLNTLLEDKTTGKNIRWACNEYRRKGVSFSAECEIMAKQLIGSHRRIIQPRVAKSKKSQKERTKQSAEVFTPSWICNEMNNHCDDVWFGRENVFNISKGKEWITNTSPIEFNDPKKTWQKYVDLKRLEITCGEGPYLVSRYDTTTGEMIPIENRIGFVDRKLRVVNENTQNEQEWFKWARRAFESSYGFEYQGDNLLLARENMLWTFIDNFQYKFKKNPTLAQIQAIANIIAWNIWQMDGLNYTTPYSNVQPIEEEPELALEGPKEITESPLLFSKIRDWRYPKTILFKELKGL